MLGLFSDLKDDTHLRVKTLDFECGEVCFCVEHKTIDARRQRLLEQEERFHAAFIVCPRMRELLPRLIMFLSFEVNSDSVSWFAAGRVQNVG